MKEREYGMNRNKRGTYGLMQAFLLLTLLLSPAALYAHTPPADPARFAKEVADLVERDAAEQLPQNGILFIGSSNIRKWPLKAGFPTLTLINNGFGGSQATDSTFYFDKLVLPFHPKLIVFHAGGNDIAAGRTPSEVASDVEDFIKKVHTELPETKIIYVGLFPAPSRWELQGKFHETTRLITATIRRDHKVTFLNPEKPLLSAEGTIRPELYESDRLHLNVQGYEIMTKLIAPYIKRAARKE